MIKNLKNMYNYMYNNDSIGIADILSLVAPINFYVDSFLIVYVF